MHSKLAELVWVAVRNMTMEAREAGIASTVGSCAKLTSGASYSLDLWEPQARVLPLFFHG